MVYPEDKGHHPSDPDKGHAKFTNYSFDPEEFVRIVEKARIFSQFAIDQETSKYSVLKLASRLNDKFTT